MMCCIENKKALVNFEIYGFHLEHYSKIEDFGDFNEYLGRGSREIKSLKIYGIVIIMINQMVQFRNFKIRGGVLLLYRFKVNSSFKSE